MDFYEKKDNHYLLFVKVTPKASRNEIGDVKDKRLSIKITTVPEDGKANKEVIKLLSKKLKIAKSDIEIIRGQKSREKDLLLFDLDAGKSIEKLINC